MHPSSPSVFSLPEAVNTLGRFCGLCDVPALLPQHLRSRLQTPQADVMVLFGGSILRGGDVLARAMQDRAARCYLIVGGEGHTTPVLREKMQALFPDLETSCMPEARLFDVYLRRRYGCAADFLETQSTNCGNNITNMLSLLRREQIPCRSIILTQDATMQRRMDAGLRKWETMQIVNFPAYQTDVLETGDALAFSREIPGMWSMERYIQLLMGEIPRLRDDHNGYGPKGKAFIAHVEIPESVEGAFSFLSQRYSVRRADDRYATSFSALSIQGREP